MVPPVSVSDCLRPIDLIIDLGLMPVEGPALIVLEIRQRP
jgi:hypothetical protein